MRLHVINLASRANRRAQFLKWNARADLDLAFVEAADGAALDPDAMVAENLIAPGSRWTPGALGCAFSHRALWREAAGNSGPMIVCEDDACLRADFRECAGALMEDLGEDWDLLFFGYNTDALVAAETPEGLKMLLQFDETAKGTPGFFENFASLRARRPTALACYQVWGALCYAITPRGAERLLDACFPMSPERRIVMFGQNRTLSPYGVDGMINAALQREPILAFCAVPALAVSRNNREDSDTVDPTL
ncbi:MAG: glycosyltransferase family 25 protein [Hyphomonadaceae bacterium]|nr:glycosyltransferase family 25 protein [Hyphomonadaceae bacterium]